MLSAARVPLFFWAEAIATACFTQNRSLVIPRHEKTPYHIINDRKPSVKFFHIFGSICYIVRYGKNLDKMKEKDVDDIVSVLLLMLCYFCRHLMLSSPLFFVKTFNIKLSELNSQLDAGQDRENIAKTFAMPYEALPMVTSLGGGEGSMQQKLQELMDMCTSLQRGMDQGEDLLVVDTVKDSDKSADKGSDSTDEMANVLGVSPAVAATSGSFPTPAIFTTASVATPTTRVTRYLKGVVTGSSSLISINILIISKKEKGKWKITKPEQPSKEKVLEQMSVQLAKDLEAKFAQEDQIIREQVERDSEIARIHAKRELKMMIAELDKSNEMVVKYLSKYEQAKGGLSHDEKVELIDELLMYQRHLAQIKKYKAQQNKPATKSERRNFYMLILRSNAGWKAKDFKEMTVEQIEEKFIPMFKKLKTAKALGTKPTQEQQSEEPKELSKEELKKMMELVPIEELYIEALQSLVKETCSTTKVTNKKAKKLWVELKRLYEPDFRDPLWALQSVSINVPTADVYIAKMFSTVEDFALLHEDKIYSELKTRAYTDSAQVLTVSTDVAVASISYDTVCAFIVTHPNGYQIKYKDISQIDDDEIEEMDIKWNMDMLSMRANRFLKKTSKKITIQGSNVANFDKSKVECFNCHKMGHFATECRSPRSQHRGKRASYKKDPKVEEPAPKAMIAIDGIGWDWSYMTEEDEASNNHALVTDEEEVPTEYALMAKSSSISDNE
nr:ribonuclease H-like domain-containing protein [Tanacetum cinerariifolium]